MEASRLKAAQEGLSRYDGKPCRICGSTERFVSNGNCVACSASHAKKYRQKVKDTLIQAREWA